MAVTLTQLRARVRNRADMTDTQFITDSADELDSWINESYLELWDAVAASFKDHFWGSASFSITTATEAGAQYTLPADFYLMRRLVRDPGTGNRYTVPQYSSGMDEGAEDLSYRLLGGVLQLMPYEQAVGSYKIYYVPGPTLLVAGSDTINARVEPWYEFIVISAAIKALTKEESDTTALERRLQDQRDRIARMAASRGAGEPERTRDVHRNGASWWVR